MKNTSEAAQKLIDGALKDFGVMKSPKNAFRVPQGLCHLKLSYLINQRFHQP